MNIAQEIDKWIIRDLFSALVSLRVFMLRINCYYSTGHTLSFITDDFDGPPNIQYCSMKDNFNGIYRKRVGDKWIHCDETEFPSFSLY